METYSQITLEERCDIARLQASGSSNREIASALDRSPSTISREIKRNSDSKGGYRPLYADQQGLARRWTGSKLDRDPELRKLVLDRLASGFSPESIAGQLALKTGRSCISYETIYRFIYAQIARTTDYSWRHLLPRAKFKRGRRGRKGGSSVSFIAHRKPLKDRSKEADDRKTPGHWEADYMLFSKYGQAVLTLYERHSRILIAARQPTREAKPTAKAIKDILAPLPPEWRQTVTFDNGTEFARHYHLHDIGIKTFFCEPRKPWQKGGVENSIGRLRRYLPRKTDLDTVSKDRFENILRSYNNTPRKCLGYRTSAEIFQKEVLHFECESTSPHTRG